MSSLEERQMVEKNQSRIDNLFALFERLNQRPDVSDEVQVLMERIEQLEAEVETLRGRVADQTKEGKLQSIIHAANNKADAGMDAVVMTYKEIKLATGVSTSQAYRYIEELPDERTEFRSREDTDKTRGLIVQVSNGENE